MSVEFTEEYDGKLLTIQVGDKLTVDDYHQFVPAMERLLAKHDQISILFDMDDFHGWKLGALWEDIKFDLKHFKDISRLAMVGDRTWEKWMATFCRPFTTAEVRYFDQSEFEQARKWITESFPVSAP